MKTVSSTLRDAIDGTDAKPLIKATVYRTRHYSSTLYSNYAMPLAPGEVIQPTNIWGQAASWNATGGYAVSAINDTLAIHMMRSDSSSVTELTTLSVNSGMRPGLYCDGNTYYLFTCETNGNVRRHTLNTSFSITASETVATGTHNDGTIHAFSGTEFVLLYLSGGAVAVEHYKKSTTWEVNYSIGKYANPAFKYTLYYQIINSAACKRGDVIYIYLTDFAKKNVVRWVYDTSVEDFYGPDECIPSDMSQLYVWGAMVYDNKIYLSGQFTRTEDLSSYINNEIYSLYLPSNDGTNFAFSRESAISKTSYAWIPLADSSYLYGVSYNRLIRNYWGDPYEIPKDYILEFSSNAQVNGEAAEITLSDSDSTFAGDNLYLILGNKVVVELGLETSAGKEYVTYGTYKIVGISRQYASGVYNITISMEHWSSASIGGLIHPFYTEITSRELICANIEEGGDLYCAPRGGIPTSWVMVNMWNCEPYEATGITGIDIVADGGATFFPRTGTTIVGVQSQLIMDNQSLVQDPVVIYKTDGTIENVVVSICAWSRSTGTGYPSTFYPILITEKADGTEAVISSYDVAPDPTYPPQSYETERAGNYPLTYTFYGTRFEQGQKIKRIAVKITGWNDTENYIERVKIAGVATLHSDLYGETGWDTTVDDSEVPVMRLNKPGRPYIMFAQKPYSADEFQMWAEYNITNDSIGTSWGLACYAKDASNCLVGRVRKTDASTYRYEFVQVIDGIETILAYSSTFSSWTDGTKLSLICKEGNIRIYSMEPSDTVWTSELTMTVVASARIAPKLDEDSYHVGVYGKIGPPALQIGSFKYTSSEEQELTDGIMIMPGYESVFATFGSTGTVKIGDSTYSYTDKYVGTAQGSNYISVGPFQCFTTQKYDGNDAIDLAWFDYSHTDSDLAGEYLMSVGYGRTWAITSSNWDIYDNTTLLFRSRHFGTNVTGNYVGKDDRGYIGLGFGGLTCDDTPGDHSEGDWLLDNCADIIDVTMFSAIGDGYEGTLKDMITRVVGMADGVATFADYELASYQITADGSPHYLRKTSDLSMNGYDISFYCPASIPTGKWLGVYTNRAFTLKGYTGNTIAIRYDGSWYYVSALNTSFNVIEEIRLPGSPNVDLTRIIFKQDSATIYSAGLWAHTFFFEDVEYYSGYGTPVAFIAISSYGSNPTVTDVCITELYKYRTGVYIEMAATSSSVLSSILQERPVLALPRADGSILFTYASDTSSIHRPDSGTYGGEVFDISLMETNTNDACASNIVAYYADVKAFYDPMFKDMYGFESKIISLPNIEEDEIYFIVRMILANAYEELEAVSLTIRPDYSIDVGDVIQFHAHRADDGTVFFNDDILVLQINYNMSGHQMSIVGRRRIGWVDV